MSADPLPAILFGRKPSGSTAKRPATSRPETTARGREGKPQPATVRKREGKAEISAFYSDGEHIARVPIVAWSKDHDALVLPRTGGRLLLAAEHPQFLGLWVMPREPHFIGEDEAIRKARKQWREDTIDQVFARFGVERKPRGTVRRADVAPEAKAG